MIKQKKDFFSGCILLLVSVYLLLGKNIAVGRTLGYMPKLADAAMYVRVLGGILGFLSILLVVRSFAVNRSTEAKRIPKEAFLSGIALILYALMLNMVGFFCASSVLIAFLTLLYRIKEKQIEKNDREAILKSVGISVIYSLVCVGALQYVFTSLLGARLP